MLIYAPKPKKKNEVSKSIVGIEINGRINQNTPNNKIKQYLVFFMMKYNIGVHTITIIKFLINHKGVSIGHGFVTVVPANDPS